MQDSPEYCNVSLCDGNLNFENKLNDFRSPLPKTLEFREPYSIALTSITFPNLMLNLNTDDNMIGVSFYQKHDDDNHDVVTRIEDTPCRLLFKTNIPVPSSYYRDIGDFSTKCVDYFEKKYNRNSFLNNPADLDLQTACIGVASIDPELSAHTAYLEAERLYLDIKKGPEPVTFAAMERMLTNTVDYCSIWDDPKWYPDDLFSNTRLAALWTTMPELETTQFFLPRAGMDLLTSEYTAHMGSRLSDLQSIYSYINRLFIKISKNMRRPSLKKHLMLSLEYYFCGICFIDLWMDHSSGIYETLTFDDDSELKTELYNWKVAMEAALSNKHLASLPRLLKSQTQLLLDKYTGHAFNLAHLTNRPINRMADGSLYRVNAYFRDMDKFVQMVRKKAGSFTNKADYIATLEHEMVYVNQKTVSTTNIYKGIVSEVRHFFSRMSTDNDRFQIKERGVFEGHFGIVNFIKIDMYGEELPTFFGLEKSSVLVDNEVTFIGNVPPNIKHKDSNLFLYCQEIEAQFLNQSMTSLLRIIPIPWEAKYGGPIHVTVTKPHFLKLRSNELHQLHFSLYNRQGEPVRFEHTTQTVVVVTVCRPTRHGIL